MCPSVPLPRVSGADSKVGLTMGRPSVQSAPAALDSLALPLLEAFTSFDLEV